MSRLGPSVGITTAADELPAMLANQLGKSKAQVIEEALRVFEERIFWRQVQQAFTRGETEQMRKERELWDSTVEDGLKERGY